jgi:hypothetical protein
MTLIVKTGFNGMTDADAIAYVNAVEAADGQLLEFGVGKAINDFVVGCKLDNTWNAIKASCILAGARTLTGALVPLIGAAPTAVGFASPTYSRTTGLLGDGTSYLNANRNKLDDPQSDCHLSAYISQAGSAARGYIGATNKFLQHAATLNRLNARLNDNTSTGITSGALNFIGATRADVNSLAVRGNSLVTNGSVLSNQYASSETHVFNSVGATATDGRIAFYSIGESLDLALLDARVTALITAFGVAIP